MGDQPPEAAWVLTVYGLPVLSPQIISIEDESQLKLSLKQLLKSKFPSMNFEGKLVEWKGMWRNATMGVYDLLSSPSLFVNYQNGKFF